MAGVFHEFSGTYVFDPRASKRALKLNRFSWNEQVKAVPGV